MDAKIILDMLMGAGARQQPAGGGGGLDAILGQVLGGSRGGAAPQGGGLGDLLGRVLGGANRGGQPQGAPGGGLGDILGQVLGGGRGQPGGHSPQGGGLGDILGQILGGGGQAPRGGEPPPQSAPRGGGLGDMLGDMLGGGQPRPAPQQVPHGDPLGDVLGGARRPAGEGRQDGGLGDVLGQLGNLSGPDALNKLKELIAQNPGLAAVLGGAGAITVGTRTGRSAMKHAVVLGGLALIGALAYKAYNGWQQGEAPEATAQGAIEKAPDGTGFDGGGDEAEQNNTALILLKAMIGSAAADGQLDEKEKARLLGNFKQMQLGDEAQAFIQGELANPASAEAIAQYGTTPEMAAQIYTAARLVVDLDSEEEKAFLAKLAETMGIDSELVAHIEAAASGMAA